MGEPASCRTTTSTDAELATRSSRSTGVAAAPMAHPECSGQLRRRGIRVGRKRVARIWPSAASSARTAARSGAAAAASTAPAPDLIGRDFTAERSDHRWVADITEFKCCDGKLFLAGIMDLHDRGFAGWSMGERQTTDLVVNALVMALARRDPDGELIHHADTRSAIHRRWSSRTGSPTGSSARRLARPGSVSTTPRWKPPGRR